MKSSLLGFCFTITIVFSIVSKKQFEFEETMRTAAGQHSEFGTEQEYAFLDRGGWPKTEFPHSQGHYYCVVAAITST